MKKGKEKKKKEGTSRDKSKETRKETIEEGRSLPMRNQRESKKQ